MTIRLFHLPYCRRSRRFSSSPRSSAMPSWPYLWLLLASHFDHYVLACASATGLTIKVAFSAWSHEVYPKYSLYPWKGTEKRCLIAHYSSLTLLPPAARLTESSQMGELCSLLSFVSTLGFLAQSDFDFDYEPCSPWTVHACALALQALQDSWAHFEFSFLPALVHQDCAVWAFACRFGSD